jgi:hypothetical protein
MTVAIAANASGQPRIDLAVLRLDRSTWTVTFQIIQGTPAASPAVPSYTQTDSTTGVWEIPLARIAVANGASTIAAGDVTNLAYHIGGWNYRGAKSAAPLTTGGDAPQFYYASDNARQYAVIDGAYQILGEAGDTVSQGTGATGWNAGNVYFRRYNGFVCFQALVTRTGANLTAGTTSTLFTIPTIYRPAGDSYLVGFAGNAAMLCHVAGATGILQLRDYGVNFVTGASLYIHPMVWPANNS